MNIKPKIALTGSEGNLGSRLVRLGAEPLFCDVTNKEEIRRELHRVKPDVILHLAAMTSVDWCQEHYAEACAVNVYGTNAVCEAAEDVIGAGKVALISSDHVFDGEKGFYDEEDTPNPINNYGLTKFAAEGVAQLYDAKIIRISRCFDSRSKDILAYLDKISCGEDVFVPQHMTKSYAHMDFIAESFYRYGLRFDKMPEILHIAPTTACSFYKLIHFIAKETGLPTDKIHPRGEEPGHTPRPFKAGLNPVLSTRLDFPIITLYESIQRFKNENS